MKPHFLPTAKLNKYLTPNCTTDIIQNYILYVIKINLKLSIFNLLEVFLECWNPDSGTFVVFSFFTKQNIKIIITHLLISYTKKGP